MQPAREIMQMNQTQTHSLRRLLSVSVKKQPDHFRVRVIQLIIADFSKSDWSVAKIFCVYQNYSLKSYSQVHVL